MLNRALLFCNVGGSVEQSIGEAGGMGFGVGVYGGDQSDLTAMGLSPMNGYDDPSSDNYGNYQHTNGSIMCFIPAFCYRVGNSATAPSYSRDHENALEIRDASLGEGDGWILHRAFIDGGQQKLGFFIDKYVCSKDSTGKKAISVKNADPISLSTSLSNSSSMTDCEGKGFDAITLGRARGDQYSCVTAFQWSAISMLSLAHGQAATSSQFCGWYDANHTTNFPKGNNNFLKDINDSFITFTAHSQSSSYCKTGSGNPFNKTTHNGQNCGISDVNGNQWQLCLGLRYNTSYSMYVMKESVRAHDFTKDNRSDTNFFYFISSVQRTNGWGSNAFYTNASYTERALCGVIPKTDSSSIALFGNDYLFVRPEYSDTVLMVSGRYDDASATGVWCRRFGDGIWDGSVDYYGFRCSGYAS